MKTKPVRITWKAYKKIRRIIYPRKNETCAEYFDRVARRLETNEL